MEGYDVRVGQLGMNLQLGDELEGRGQKSEGEGDRLDGEVHGGAPFAPASRAPSWT